MSTNVLLTGLPSDAHTWNLVYLDLWLSERGYKVHCLGNCVPVDDIIQALLIKQPDLLVVSTLNGHGAFEARQLARKVEEEANMIDVHMVIGGILSVDPENNEQVADCLRRAGYERVFTSDQELDSFEDYLNTLGGERE